MRAPDTKAASFDLTLDWPEIEASLAACGIADVYREMVDGRFGLGRFREVWWGWEGWDDYFAAPRPLPEVLNELVWLYNGRALNPEPPSPFEQAKQLQPVLTAFETDLALLGQTDVLDVDGYDHIGYDQMDARRMDAVALGEAMTRFIGQLRERIATLHAMGTRSDQNSRLLQTDYWNELERLWLKVTGSAGPLRRRLLRRFLRACTPLSLFGMTTSQRERGIDSFFSNRSRSQERRA